MSHKIGVIESDEIDRIGWVAALGATGLNVVDAASPDETTPWTTDDWRRFDALVVGVTADPTSWDRYHCIGAIGAARRANPNVRVIALCDTGMPPLVHRRLQMSGAGRIWSSRLTRTLDDLAALLATKPHPGDTVTRPRYEVRAAMVGHRTDPAAVLDYVVDHELTDVFDHIETQAETGLSRRQIIRLRRDITELADLSVPSGYLTGGPIVDRSLPSWKACVDYVNRARGHRYDAQVFTPSFARGLAASA